VCVCLCVSVCVTVCVCVSVSEAQRRDDSSICMKAGCFRLVVISEEPEGSTAVRSQTPEQQELMSR